MRFFIMIGLLVSGLYAASDAKLQFQGVSVEYNDKEIKIDRTKDYDCYEIGVTPENIFGGNMASKKVPEVCKKSFVSALGVVQPMSMGEGIKTVGELEIINFYKKMEENPHQYLMLDARKKPWYEKLTMPHAQNIAYTDIAFDAEFPEDFARNLKMLNITKDKKGKLDFSQAKEIVVFCNASWCVQSAKAIKALSKLGYPKEKMLWYRGGLQDWAGFGFTAVKP